MNLKIFLKTFTNIYYMKWHLKLINNIVMCRGIFCRFAAHLKDFVSARYHLIFYIVGSWIKIRPNSSISFKCYSTIFCDKKCRKSIFIQFILILCVQFIFSYYFWYVYLTNNIIKILIGGKIENFINSPSVCEFSFSFLTSSQKRQHLLLNKINSKYVTCG